mgnify:CR=1 FL=1
MKPYILVALPCYNEAENLPPLMENFDKLNALHGNNFETRVVIINDCSKDDTDEVVKNLKCNTKFEYVKHEVNKGLTGGINTALNLFNSACNSDTPPFACGLMDGDNSHHPINFERMMPRIAEGYDIVVASRYRPGSRIEGVAWWRQILSAGLGLLFKLLRNIPGVKDYSCGYRLYSPNIIKKVVSKYGPEVVLEKSFASMVEVLVKCHNEGAICTEVPFLLRYDLKLGESKMPFKKTIIGNLKLLSAVRKS